MCPNGYRFFRELECDLVFATTTTAAGQVFDLKPDPARVGIIAATNFGAGRLQTVQTSGAAFVNLREFGWQSNTSTNYAWIYEFGPVLLNGLRVVVDTNNVVVRIWNLRCNKDFK